MELGWLKANDYAWLALHRFQTGVLQLGCYLEPPPDTKFQSLTSVLQSVDSTLRPPEPASLKYQTASHFGRFGVVIVKCGWSTPKSPSVSDSLLQRKSLPACSGWDQEASWNYYSSLTPFRNLKLTSWAQPTSKDKFSLSTAGPILHFWPRCNC